MICPVYLIKAGAKLKVSKGVSWNCSVSRTLNTCQRAMKFGQNLWRMLPSALTTQHFFTNRAAWMFERARSVFKSGKTRLLKGAAFIKFSYNKDRRSQGGTSLVCALRRCAAASGAAGPSSLATRGRTSAGGLAKQSIEPYQTNKTSNHQTFQEPFEALHVVSTNVP